MSKILVKSLDIKKADISVIINTFKKNVTLFKLNKYMSEYKNFKVSKFWSNKSLKKNNQLFP